MNLLAPDYRCGCGTRPNWRLTEAVRELHAHDDPETVIGTWQCQRCLETHVITAKAYQQAQPRRLNAA